MEFLTILFLACFFIQMILCLCMIKLYLDDKILKDKQDFFNFLTKFNIYSSEKISNLTDELDEIKLKLKNISTKELHSIKDEMIYTLYLEREILLELNSIGAEDFINAIEREDKILLLVLDEIENRDKDKDWKRSVWLV